MSIDGLILVDKPEGMTSFGTDIYMRKVAQTKKVGHLGTLDPFATGLLPVACGGALKYLRFCENYDKTYRCEALFGASTDTMDLTGEVIRENYPSEEELERLEHEDFESVRKAFAEVARTTEQLPPKYSAKKIDGKRACDLVRAGENIELKPNRIQIFSLVINSITRAPRGFIVNFDTHCSKGTYIRTICDDCGRLTGYGAHAISLRRTGNGPFRVEGALTPERIAAMAESGDFSFVRPASEMIAALPEIELDAPQASFVRNGRRIVFPESFDGNGKPLYRATYNGVLIAVVYPKAADGKVLMCVERGFC
ncbi:MAG: tRNA pseudouridine(55) synthase TruB [Saccharofermentans sp.]|jgi:tRNA pseudouridine55 synthase|nr:tRNA pseudouridine(55) synthase TruB [Mageeibacillus sp.]MCI1264809.1 tRNA pseudouridine(55) synthase TruB [Saccharofermentans sp.]MCI1275462.1 tRNA pseudouridine(55) synthase TruB [Saccharofermentans sp.]MCI1769398.1 tRNA pseudouridine(55) synthase TruB [Mageeibacillus sp.]MCI2044503.1 tRNA pseudouridine(55) synthase TruB [Mageeibacillus sp.]